MSFSAKNTFHSTNKMQTIEYRVLNSRCLGSDYIRVGSAVIAGLPDDIRTVIIQGQTTIGAVKKHTS